MSTHFKEVDHHKQIDLCSTRAAYRQGRKLTAVKVYTVTSESQHLFVYGVPSISLRSELKSLFTKYGHILNLHIVSDHKVEIFTECFHVQYDRIASARIAKRLLDNRSFYGGILHVCYAPEYETLEETSIKMQFRERDIIRRVNNSTSNVKSSAPNLTQLFMNNMQPKTSNIEWENKDVSLQQLKPIYEPTDSVLSRKKQKTSHIHTLEYSETVPSMSNTKIILSKRIIFEKEATDVNSTQTSFIEERSQTMNDMSNNIVHYSTPPNSVEEQIKAKSLQDVKDKVSSIAHVSKIPDQPQKRIVFRNKEVKESNNSSGTLNITV